jgi:hypothetical protein
MAANHQLTFRHFDLSAQALANQRGVERPE